MKILTTLGSLLLALILIVTPSTGALAQPNSPTPQPTDSTEAADTSATIHITEVTPWLDENGTFKLAGKIETTANIKNPRLSLRMTRNSLSSVDSARTWQEGTPTGTRQLATAEKLPKELRAGTTTSFSFELTPAQMGLRKGNPLKTWGVRGIAVALSGDSQNDTVAKPQTTFTTWYPHPKIDPTRINMVVPITLTGYSEDGLISQDELATATDDGPLKTALDIARSYPNATLAIDPRVVESVDRVLNPPLVEQPEQTAPPQDPEEPPRSIADWWDELKKEAESSTVVALPWADADLVGLQQHDLSNYKKEALRSRSIVKDHFPNALDSWAWVGTGSASMDSLAQFANDGVTNVMLSDTQLPTSDGGTVNAVQHLWKRDSATTPLTTFPRDRKPDMTTVATSANLAETFVTPGSSRATRVAELAAKSALITNERPFDQRSLVLALPRGGTQKTWTEQVRTLASLPWVKPQTFDDTLKAEPGTRLPLQDGNVPSDISTALNDLKEPGANLNEFSSVFVNRADVRQEFNRSALTCTSIAWRTQPSAKACTTNFAKSAGSTMSGLNIERGSNVLLVTGEKTTIPVTIHNTTHHAARLRVRINSASPQLKVGNSPLVEIPPGQRARVEVPVTGLANANLDTTIHIVATDGYTVRDSSPLQVQVRVDWENIGIAAIGISLSIVFVVALFFSVRRGRPKIPKSQLEAALARAEQ
ncbi:DUF6049 family protein [Brevibacterium sp. UMB1308A]|uniref:DUF6049 family protein n=1 Tax=Brevibacterium sp. UMB1308A TaxID=3050608 RepID=UPI002550C7D0|nr:DUF6049 family protein [Brevibacterium sp. UMB1308A]MDK8346101.1 DUF6049 family protein [Brevibacterium sp. UMB1308B]MDK8713104.1 DUF6049 family protein [Brevibacterium sp. UMB1308A]